MTSPTFTIVNKRIIQLHIQSPKQYSFFGKNQKDEEVINKIDKEIKDLVSDKQDPVADEVPF